MWIGADMYVEFVLRLAIKFARRIGTSDWPACTAIVVSSKIDCSFTGCRLVVIHYRYRNAERRHDGVFKQPFVNDNYAKAYLHRYPGGSDFPVFVSPNRPSYSIPVEGKIEFIKVP
jgi:hypothetical protein